MLQPLHADRPDCPYLISVYSQCKYPLTIINKILNYIQVCEHGWYCEKCCYEYNGRFTRPTTKRESTRWILIYTRRIPIPGFHPWIKVLFSRIIMDIFFGLDTQGVVESTTVCGTSSCVNIQHFSMESRKHGSVTERFWRGVKLCIHGESCLVCHWMWLGQYEESVSGELLPMASTNNPKFSARRAGAVAFSLPLKPDDGIYPRCKNYQCVNPYHFFIMHKNTAQNAIRNRRFDALLEQHKLSLAQP